MNIQKVSSEDLLVWPDGTTCSRTELPEYGYMSDDHNLWRAGCNSEIKAAYAMGRKARVTDEDFVKAAAHQKVSPFAPRSDTELLNWMISRGAHISHNSDSENCTVWLAEHDGTLNRQDGEYLQQCYYTAREAILHAMHEESKRAQI